MKDDLVQRANELIKRQVIGTLAQRSADCDPKGRELTLADLFYELQLIRQDLASLRSDLAVTFSLDEFDKQRKEMSQRLGEIVLKRLAAEEAVRSLYAPPK